MISSKAPIWLIVLGSLLALGPLLGLVATMIGMMRTGNYSSVHGSEDPEQLSAAVDFAVRMTALGIIMCPIGIVLLTVGIVWQVVWQVKKSKKEGAPDQGRKGTS